MTISQQGLAEEDYSLALTREVNSTVESPRCMWSLLESTNIQSSKEVFMQQSAGKYWSSGTPRPKTISARDSSAQIDFLLGLLGPGLLDPVIKDFICGIQWKTNVYLVCFISI